MEEPASSTFFCAGDERHELLEYNVEWNAMAVVNRLNADAPLEFYHFFQEDSMPLYPVRPVVERILPADGRHLAAVDEGNSEGLSSFFHCLGNEIYVIDQRY